MKQFNFALIEKTLKVLFVCCWSTDMIISKEKPEVAGLKQLPLSSPCPSPNPWERGGRESPGFSLWGVGLGHQIIVRTWPPVVFLTWLNRTIQEYDLQDGHGLIPGMIPEPYPNPRPKPGEGRYVAGNRARSIYIYLSAQKGRERPQPLTEQLSAQAWTRGFSSDVLVSGCSNEHGQHGGGVHGWSDWFRLIRKWASM